MSATSTETVLLLPERRRFAGQPLAPAIAKRLARADRLPDRAAGEREQLLRHYELLPRGWPMAAISREFERKDAAGSAWLRADPVHVRPDMGGARLMAWGSLGISDQEADALQRELRPLFGDAGFPLSRTAGERWYLQLPREAKLPSFASPAESLGDDLLRHLPEGPDGRRWRSLLNEAQILLHQHPLNAARAARGQLPINSLWFWGAGALPDAVRSRVRTLESDDVELLALASLVREREPAAAVRMIDLRDQRQWAQVEAAVSRALQAASTCLVLDFADGAAWRIVDGQGWRFWRRPLATLA